MIARTCRAGKGNAARGAQKEKNGAALYGLHSLRDKRLACCAGLQKSPFSPADVAPMAAIEPVVAQPEEIMKQHVQMLADRD